MKKLLTLFIAFMASTCIWADDIFYDNEGKLYYQITSESTVAVKRYYDSSNDSDITSVIIPSTVTYEGKTYSVTRIRESAFNSCKSLTSITIPEGVTSIENGAFYGSAFYDNPSNWEDGGLYINGCLIRVKDDLAGHFKIKDNTRLIGNQAFEYCSHLTSITIPNSVTSIGAGAFRKCESLTSITIPEGVTSIGAGAFAGCDALKSITIPNSVTSIGDATFYSCESLTSITIPSSITSIGEEVFDGTAFYNNTSNWGNGALYINNCLIAVDRELSGNYSIKSGTRLIAGGAFKGCSKLPSITIPSSVKHIGAWAFCGCNALKSITIPNGVTNIGDGAFASCDVLKSISIPNSITSIGVKAFSSCYSLQSITIPNSVTSIGRSAFYECVALTSITIGNSVTSIEEGVFEECKSLTSITIPNSVKSIGEEAFIYCESLTSITIPEGVTSIGDYAFAGCKALKSINIPNSVTSIGTIVLEGTAFQNNPSNWENGVLCINGCLIRVKDDFAGHFKIEDNTRLIAGGAFRGCKSLTSITIPNSITSIKNQVFSGCTALQSITIPSSVTSIGEGAFYGCSSLTSIIIPESVKSIGDGVFDECNSLKKIFACSKNKLLESEEKYNVIYYDTIVDGCVISSKENLEGYAEIIDIVDPTNLTSITIPEDVEVIWDEVFNQCKSLKSITWNAKNCETSSPFAAISNNITSFVLGDQVELIPAGLCSGMSQITSITIPNSVKSIGVEAFKGSGIYTNTSNWENGALYINNCLIAVDRKLSGNFSIKPGTRFIADGAFEWCSDLTSITIPNSVIHIGNNTFYHCSSLKSIIIPESVTSIGDYTFVECEELTEIYLCSNNAFGDLYGDIVILYDKAVDGCVIFDNEIIAVTDPTNMTSVVIPECVTIIGWQAFKGCTALASVTIPESITSIESNAFIGCTRLTDITIPSSVTSIEEDAFDSCSSLTSVTLNSDTIVNSSKLKDVFGEQVTEYVIGNGVTSIGKDAFTDCSALTSITIPVSVTSIGAQAFYGCEALQTLNYAGTKKQWKSIEDTNLTIDPKKQVIVICSDGEVKLKGK